MRKNLRVLKNNEVIEVLTAAEQRPSTYRDYPVYPHGLLLALGFSLLCWVVILAVLYGWWH